MKVMYIDIETSGHHQTYLQALLDIPNKENVIVLPSRLSSVNDKQYVFQKTDFYHKKLKEYIRWTHEVKRIIRKEQPDVVHFLYGDVFYKYFGIGLEGLKKKCKVINTVHALKKGKIGLVSLKRIASLSSVIVVHTDAICREVRNAGITNIEHIEYPHFSTGYNINTTEARKYYGLGKESFVLGCIGSTRYDKGLDILLTALQKVTGDFELLIAGAEEAIKKAEIEKLASCYKERVHLHLAYLDDEELEMAFQAVDAIVLPYRNSFNGASGPLGEGVGKEKMIIGTDHGSIGDIITKNHLGYTYESENIEKLAEVIDNSMNRKFSYDTIAKNYKNCISQTVFKNKYAVLYSVCKFSPNR